MNLAILAGIVAVLAIAALIVFLILKLLAHRGWLMFDDENPSHDKTRDN